MKNVSIRTRILVGVVVVNLLGAIAMVVYLHQSYSGGLDVSATAAATHGRMTWTELEMLVGNPDPRQDPAAVARLVQALSDSTGAQYGYLLAKDSTDEATYAAMREKLGQPDNWSEGETYVLLAASESAATDRMTFEVPPGDIPEIGKVIGVENGACSKTCHNAVEGSGDYWTVKWSTDSVSRAHAVFPVIDAQGTPIGAIYTLGDISAQADTAKSLLIQTLLVTGLTLIVATLAIGYMIDVWVFRRLRRMVASMEDISIRVAGGDFDAQFVPDGSGDEIGTFEQFFANLINLMSGTIKSLMGKR